MRDALDLLKAKRKSLLWKVTRKEVDFDHAYPDYVKWKNELKKEQKAVSITRATQNCVDDNIGDGLLKDKAEKAVHTHVMVFPSLFMPQRIETTDN